MKKNISLDIQKFKSLQGVQEPQWTKVLQKLFLSLFIFAFVILTFTPWLQTSHGFGRVIAFDPNDRLQNINATVIGRIKKWHVRDGSKVKEGDPIVELVDNDPNFIDRLRMERDAALAKYEAAKAASETSLINYDRQKELFETGLSARTKFEKAKIEYKKLLSSEATAAASLAKAEVKLSRQQTQIITAPKDGTILRVLHGSNTVMVNEGDVLATFVPKTILPAAEIFVDGNDLPLVQPGRHVRLQFEGWPAIQFSGWPSVSIGTFGGIVSIVDPSVTEEGKFRVIITPDENEPWPEMNILRQGNRVQGWVLLNQVSLGFELWRQFNGFPKSLSEPPTTEIFNFKDKKKKKKDE